MFCLLILAFKEYLCLSTYLVLWKWQQSSKNFRQKAMVGIEDPVQYWTSTLAEERSLEINILGQLLLKEPI